MAAHASDLNSLDRLISWVSPSWGRVRARDRLAMAHYEAARPSRERKFSSDRRGPNLLVDQGADALRTQVRHLERNHDLVVGAINVLVNNTVGASGIGVEFQPRRMDGTIHTEYAAELSQAYADWCRKPEVTWQHNWPGSQRLLARTWLRDGEAFAQRLKGLIDTLDHGTLVPYSLELLEPDVVPMALNDTAANIRQGIRINAWGRPISYSKYKTHPGEGYSGLPTISDTKEVPAARMLHLAHRTRIGQLRGVTPFASVLTRISDIKEYEEAERLAAKIAASLTAYVKRQSADGEGYIPNVDPKTGEPIPRDLRIQPGTIIDTLAIGEEIGLIDSKRPNPNLITFRNGQLRAFAAGISASYSSVSRNYDGTFSAQRQEMVEQFVHYAALTDQFVASCMAPVITDFVDLAHISRVARMPVDLMPGTADDVLYIAPSMPWIDPAKEAAAWLMLVKAGFASEVEVIRRRGQSPEAVLRQVAEWRRKCAEQGVVFDSDAGSEAQAQAQADKPDPQDAPQRQDGAGDEA